MTLPLRHRHELERLPAPLRALLDAELAAGNEITEVASTFPAPPAGLYVMLARPVSTRARASGDGVLFFARNTPQYSGEFHDERRFYFVLEPPLPPPAEPDMAALRATLEARQRGEAAPAVQTASDRKKARPRSKAPPAEETAGARPPRSDDALAATPRDQASAAPVPSSPLGRFVASMVIDYEKWHEGIGYDLDALREASDAERMEIERILVGRPARDWRDVEALALLGTDAARRALRDALRDGGPEVRAAVVSRAPGLLSEEERIAVLVRGIREARPYQGLDAVIREATDFHPAPVVDALVRATLEREGEVAVHFAALLYCIHGITRVPFDWDLRPFFLRFGDDDRAGREEAFRALCAAVKVEPGRYLPPTRS